MSRNKRILIVEDDRVVNSSLQRLLRESDCLIETAACAQEGIEKFQREPYDFVLTDLKLPDMNGLDMIGQMRQSKRELPFVVLSAYAERDDALRALKLGALDFFQKPFDVQQILQVTRNCLQDFPALPGSDVHLPELAGVLSELVMKSQNQTDLKPDQPNLTAELLQLQGLLAPCHSIGRLTSGIAHNLNGHLTGLIGHLELMQMKYANLRDELENVLSLAKKIRDNVADLSNKFDYETTREPQPQNLNQILRAELTFLRADLFFKHFIATSLELQEPLANVYGYYADFALSFEEIITNAIDVQRDQKKGTMRIRTQASEDQVKVIVEDGGPGFSPEALEHAFDPLWPGVRILEDSGLRRGLGLYLARQWLASWEGKIEIANLPGRGARVSISLPKREKVPIR